MKELQYKGKPYMAPLVLVVSAIYPSQRDYSVKVCWFLGCAHEGHILLYWNYATMEKDHGICWVQLTDNV